MKHATKEGDRQLAYVWESHDDNERLCSYFLIGNGTGVSHPKSGNICQYVYNSCIYRDNHTIYFYQEGQE